MSLRTTAKTIVEYGALWSGAASRARIRHVRDVLVLAYHNVVPHGESVTGDRSLHLTQAAFADQLDALRETHDIVSLDDALGTTAPAATVSSRPRAVITFDDAYRGAVLAGVSELRRRNLPATIFVPPAFIDGGDFWWDVLTPRGAAGLDDAVRDHALAACAGQDATVRAWAKQQNMSFTPSPRHMTCASEAELRAAVTETRITLGAHSWSHPNLTRLDATTLARELHEPYAWLLQRFPRHTVAAISYPYGCVDATVQAGTRDAGLTGFLITGGFTTLAPADRTAVPRLNIPAGVSRNGFIMRAAGLLSD